MPLNDNTTADTAAIQKPALLPDGHVLVAPVVIRPHYAIGYETFDHAVFMHLRLFPGITGADSDALERDVATCSEMLGLPLFAVTIPGNDGFTGILSELHFKPHGEIENGGQTVEVLVREPRAADISPAGAVA